MKRFPLGDKILLNSFTKSLGFNGFSSHFATSLFISLLQPNFRFPVE